MACFLSAHNLSDESEQVTFCPSLIVGASHFTILGKNFLQSHLFIIRVCPQNNITHILTLSTTEVFYRAFFLGPSKVSGSDLMTYIYIIRNFQQ